MDQCFRIALWMCLLIGYLQARAINNCTQWPPIEDTIAFEDLGFELLKNEVKCGPDVTFTSPTQVQKLCYSAALDVFIKGLTEAKKSCQGVTRIADTLEAFEDWYTNKSDCPPPSQCKWENMESRKVFTEYVDIMKTFVNQLISEGASGPPTP